MVIFGVDVDKHLKELEERDQMSATLMKELILRHDRMRRHVDVVQEQCQEYIDDIKHLNQMLQALKYEMEKK